MKFDYCIGNPPYQENMQNTSDVPVYNDFMDAAYTIADKVELITPARFLFDAGKTPKDWNHKMLNDEHFKVMNYEVSSKNVFANTDIKGGVAIHYRDASSNFGAIGVFSAFPEMNSIKNKVFKYVATSSLDDCIVQQNRWDLNALYADYPKYKAVIGSDGKERRLTTSIFTTVDLFHEDEHADDVKILGLVKNKRLYKYVPKKYIESNHDNLDKWKVIIPKSNGSGAIGEVLGTPLCGTPLCGYTQSFIGIGAFDTESEAIACLKYVKSKFTRACLGILKITQDNNKGTWKYVPLQDFTSNSDIDWDKSISDIDKQLYQKYGLSDDEINFIETHVKEK